MIEPILYNADCLDILEITKPNSIDMVITSPPYYNARPEYSEWPSYEAYLEFMKRVLFSLYRVLKPEGRIAINVPDSYSRNPSIPLYADICKIMQGVGYTLRGSIVWYKQNGAGKTSWGSWCSPSNPSLIDEHEMIIIAHKEVPNIKSSDYKLEPQRFLDCVHSVWKIAPESSIAVGHPAPFPVELPRRLLEFYTNPGAIVFDPFIGSGSIALACIELDRRCIGVELSKEYYDLANKRIDRVLSQTTFFDLLGE